MKKIIIAIAIVFLLPIASTALADDGFLNRKSISREAESSVGGYEDEAEHTFIQMMKFYVQTQAADGTAVIEVEDHGIGIAQQHLPRIFDPFFTTKSKGHGLGLATCHSIIKRHGGAITVESRLGEGTTFTVMLPVG